MATKKTKEYQVQAKLELLVAVDISAASLSEAMEKAILMSIDDFAEIQGEYLEGEFRISGIYESNP